MSPIENFIICGLFFSSGFSISLVSIFLFFCILLFFFKLITSPHKIYSSIKETKFSLPIFIFVLFTFISCLFAINKKNSFKEFTSEYLIFCYLILIIFNLDYEKRKRFLYLFVAGVAIDACFGIIQYLSGIDFLDYTGAKPILKNLALITGRSHGLRDHFITFGECMMIGIFSCLMIEKKTIKYLLISVIFTSLILSKTRGAWIGFFVGLLFYEILRSKILPSRPGEILRSKILPSRPGEILRSKILPSCPGEILRSKILPSCPGEILRSKIPKYSLLILTVTVIFAIFSKGDFAKRFKSIYDFKEPSVQTRIQNFQVALKIIKDYPLFGVGNDNIQLIYQNYTKEGWQPTGNIHNNYLNLAAERGLITLIIFLWLNFVVIKKLLVKKNYESLVYLAIIISFLVAGLTEAIYEDSELAIIYYLILGLSEKVENKYIEME